MKMSAARSLLSACSIPAFMMLVFSSNGTVRSQDVAGEISFHKQIRPIFQAHCQGCHQPARAKSAGSYVMTSFDLLLKAGESEDAPIVAGKPDESALVKLITPENGEAAMPRDQKPLHSTEIELIRKWIEQGAKNDAPASAELKYDSDHPPVYVLPPVITSLDYSPDGSLIAVAGYHEVLLHKADGSGIAARLVGLAERARNVGCGHGDALRTGRSSPLPVDVPVEWARFKSGIPRPESCCCLTLKPSTRCTV